MKTQTSVEHQRAGVIQGGCMEYRLHVQRLSTGEHKVTAYPTSGDVLHKTYPTWQDLKSAFFPKYIGESGIEGLNSALAKASYGIDVFEGPMCVDRAVIDSLGFD